LVEDSEDVLYVLQLELEDMGYEVVPAASAEDALSAAAVDKPDVIVSDLGLPGIDGLDFIKRIRQMPALAGVPAIALTGSSMDRDIQRALTAGFTAHLTKPVEGSELGKRIELLTASYAQRKAG